MEMTGYKREKTTMEEIPSGSIECSVKKGYYDNNTI